MTSSTTSTTLAGRRVVIIGAGSHTGRVLGVSAAAAGADVVLAGPDPRTLEWTAGEIAARCRDPAGRPVRRGVDRQARRRRGRFDHLVSTAAMHADGPVTELELDAVRRAFDTKVIGPLLLAKHLSRQAAPGRLVHLVLRRHGMAAPDRAERYGDRQRRGGVPCAGAGRRARADPGERDLPGIVDSGSWDWMGADKEAFLLSAAERNPARRVGSPDDLVQAVLYAIGNPT